MLSLGDPLFALCRGRTIFGWGLKQAKAFRVLKEALEQAPVLKFPRWYRLL